MTPEQQAAIQRARSRTGGLTPEQQAAIDRARGPQADMSFTGRLKDNIVGVDDGVDSIGERIGTIIRGGGAAVARGIADVPAIPANLAQLGAMGVEKAFGMEEPSMVSRGLGALPDTRDMLAAVPVIGTESQFQAPGTVGEFVSTMGEFAGGAGGLAGAGNMIRYGAVPGAASEGAGQLTEGTAAEPYARVGAGLAAAYMAAPRAGAFAGADESSKMANTLQEAGVRNVTAGQARGSQGLMAAEGRLQPTAQQIDDFTASTMKQLGSTKKLATPQNLREVETQIVKQMSDAVKGVSVVPTAKNAKQALDVAKMYAERVPSGQLTPRMRGIADEIRKLAVSKTPISAAKAKEWRSDIGKLTTSSDQATRDAAHGLRSLIDEMTDTALINADRADDIGKLASARESYRNYIAVRDAASRAGAEGGTLSPQQLNQSMIRAQGREAYATGRTTDMGEFTRAGASILRSAPTVQAGGVRSIAGAAPLASAALSGGGALQAGLGPGLAGAMAAGALTLPAISRAGMRSNFAQGLLRNPTNTLTQPLPTLPGLMSAN